MTTLRLKGSSLPIIININTNYPNVEYYLASQKVDFKKIQEFLGKSNTKFIIRLASFFNDIGEILKKNQKENIKIFNEEYIDFIEKFCIFFFEKEIVESEGLTFMANYYNKLRFLMEDINYYANKEDWDLFEMEIKN